MKKEKFLARVQPYIEIRVQEVLKSNDNKIKNPSHRKTRAKTKTPIENYPNSHQKHSTPAEQEQD